MEDTLRRRAAAGVALVAAGLVAAIPAIAPAPTTADARGVAFTADSAGLDPITPWEQVFNTTTANAQTVFNAAPEAVNTLFQGVSADPAELSDNLQTALQAVSLIGAPDDVASAVVPHTLGGVTEATGGPLNGGLPIPIDNVHIQVYEGLVGQGFTLPPGVVGELVAALANFASSPLSGVLIGALGPVVSPEVALFNSGQATLADLTGPDADPTAALADLVNTPANVVNGFFNGATLDLNVLAPALQQTLFAANEGEVINGLSFAFGGLFSPGSVVDGVGGVTNGVGGSILNAVGADLSFVPPDDYAGGTLDIPAIGVGPIAAIAGLVDIIGLALGGGLLG